MAHASAKAERPARQTGSVTASASPSPAGWLRATFGQSAIGAALLWAALPPFQWWPLAWLAPIAWIRLAERRELEGRRPYLALWLSGFLFWLAAIYWLTLPHWATAFGWLALSAYLAIYIPVFIGLTRVAIHQWHTSVVLAAPLVWTGLELVRAHVLGGFMLAGLGHTQYRWLELIQISDLAGAYAVSFLIVLVAACLSRMLPLEGRKAAVWPILPAITGIALTLSYGLYRLSEHSERPGPKVALIQGSIDTEMKADPNQSQQIYDQYRRLSERAVLEDRYLDLIVWPETMFRTPWYVFAPGYQPPADAPYPPSALEKISRENVRNTVAYLRSPMLLGMERLHHLPDRVDRFNSALLADRSGQVIGQYDKVHLVMFGEYVPLADWFPWLYQLTPLPFGLASGDGPRSFTLGAVRYAPNICFESTVPHLIRSQVVELRERGEEPDVLVNLTNDGWFWGSSELDMHLVCSVFRAVECRKPFLIAANTGISAWIDSNGRILAQGGRRQEDVIIASPSLDSRRSWYLAGGDWAAGVCLAFCCALALAGGWRYFRSPVAAGRAA